MPDRLRVSTDSPETGNRTHSLLVVPCYNEASRLKLSAFDNYLAGCSTSSILFVDDGSKDQTADVIGEFCRSHPDRTQLMSLPQNSGKAEAVRLGLLAAADTDAECVGFWDADLATPLEAAREFAHVLTRCPDVHVVWGTRLPLLGRAIERHPVRKLLGKVFSGCSAIATGLPIQDALCGAKMFRNGPLFRDLFGMPFQSRWIFDVEILIRLRALANSKYELPIDSILFEFPLEQWQEIGGSRLRMKDFARAGIELAGLFWQTRIRGIDATPLLPVNAAADSRRAA
ncbi:MAG: glycosyltransferase [Thermomicrobiales bacterium]